MKYKAIRRSFYTICALILGGILYTGCTPFFSYRYFGADCGIGVFSERDLKLIKENLEGKYCLFNDIHLMGSFEPIGSDSEAFTGTFNGRGHEIDGLVIAPGGTSIGLFAKIADGAEVKNFTIRNAVIEGSEDVGVLAGVNEGEVSNVGIQESVVNTHPDASYVGGLVGRNTGGGSIQTSYVHSVRFGLEAGGAHIGGLVGRNEAGIENGYAISTGLLGDSQIGGFVGSNGSTGSIKKSYAVPAEIGGSLAVGRLAGENQGAIEDSYVDAAHGGGSILVVGSGNSSGVTPYYTVSIPGSESLVRAGTTSNDALISESNFSNWSFPDTWFWIQDGRWPRLAWE